MKNKTRTPRKKLAILFSSFLIIVGFLSVLPFYLSYREVTNLADECYDKGGLPSIDKSGVKINHFSCEL